MGRSRSSSSQTQQSLAFDDQSVKEVAQAATAVDLSNINSVGTADIDINSEGLDAAAVAGIVDKLTQVNIETARAGAASSQAVQDIAKNATATETEIGRLTGKFAAPVAFVVLGVTGVFAYFRAKRS